MKDWRRTEVENLFHCGENIKQFAWHIFPRDTTNNIGDCALP